MNHNGASHRSKSSQQKLQGTDCLQTIVHNKGCHDDKCHNSSSYLNGCDTWSGDIDCDNLTVAYNVHNSTGWRNTTCNLFACGDIINDDCADGNYTYRSCTNDDCYNGVTRIHGCYNNAFFFNQVTGPSVLTILGVNDNLKDFFDIPCINLLFYNLQQRRLGRKQ